RGQSIFHGAGSEQSAHRLGRIAVLGDACLKRSLLAHGAGVFGAQGIQMPLPFGLRRTLRFQIVANLSELRGERAYPLRRGLELQAELPALSPKALELLIGGRS